MTRTIKMTEGKPLRLLFSFALPLMFGNMFQQLYTVVDTAVVGRGVGMDALAALGTVDWLNWLFIGIAQGFTQGFSVRVSQKYGEGDGEGLKRVAGCAAVLSAVIAMVGAVSGHLMLPQFLQLLRVPEDLQGMAQTYIRVLLTGFPAVMFFNYCSAVLRAVGDSKTPLRAMVAASVTNIALDVLAVFVLRWGIAGAALATVFSQCLSGLICALRICKTPQLRFSKEQMKPQTALSKDLMFIGMPMAAKNIVIALGGMAVQTVVNGFEMSFIAGFTATNKLYGLLEIAALSYGYAVTTYVGQNYGAMKLDRIKSGMRAASLLSVATSLVIAAVMFLLGRQITMLFISSESKELMEAAGNTAYRYLCTMSAFLPVLYLLYAYQAGLQGMGNTVVPMLSGMLEFGLRVGVSIAIGMSGQQEGIFFAEITAWTGAMIFLFAGYVKTYKKACRSLRQ